MKQFGKLSTEDFALFLHLSSVFLNDIAEGQNVLAEKADKCFADDCAKAVWCHLYELPIIEHAMMMAKALGDTDIFTKLSASSNQIQAMQEELQAFDVELETYDPDEQEKELLRINLAAIFALSFSLAHSFRALMTFGMYLNEMVALVRAGGNDAEKALLNAVKIDPTVLGCPPVITYFSKQQLLGNATFLKKLRKAVGGTLSKREQRNYQKMRVVLQVLHETGFEKLSSHDLYELFVEELKLIKGDINNDIGDVENNLRQFAYQFMKQKTVSKN